MKKISLIILFILSLSACKNDKAEVKKETVQETKPEAKTIERKGDETGTEFVLVQSDYDPKKTYFQLKSYLETQGMYYPRLIDHQTAAKNANVEIPQVYLVVFGNPKESGKLIKENPEVALEFPQKALIYKDAEGRTWVLYKKMNYIKDLYSLKDKEGMIEKMNKTMEGFKQAVINPIHTTQIRDEDLQ